MPDVINDFQEIQLELIRRGSFNDFDGPLIADVLVANKHLWSAVIFDREGYCDFTEGTALAIDLIKLRDLEAGYWNVDTLFILPEQGQEDALWHLAQSIGADEVDWEHSRDCGRYLRVWFD